MSPWVSIIAASLKYQGDYNSGAVEPQSGSGYNNISSNTSTLSTLLCSNFTLLI